MKWAGILFALVFTLQTMAADAVYSLTFKRRFGNMQTSVDLQCSTDKSCVVKKTRGTEILYSGVIAAESVIPRVKGFFGRLPASEVTTPANIEYPGDAVVTWVVGSNGKKNWGWVTSDEFNGSYSHKREVLDQVLALESQIENLAR